MFDIGAAELLVIIVVAVIVIGPKDMPLAMRTAGRWIGKVRRISAHFRTGIDSMVREAELEDMEAKWKARNAEIMNRTGGGKPSQSDETTMTGPPPIEPGAEAKPATDPETGTAPRSDRPAPVKPGASDPANPDRQD